MSYFAAMSIWIILSWVFVLVLTAINVFVFLKMKQASDQMMKMAFPGAKNMNEALAGMQQMMGGMSAGGFNPGMSRGPRPGPVSKGGQLPQGQNMDTQLKAAMDMLQKIQKGNKK